MKAKLIKQTPEKYILCVDEQEVQRFESALSTTNGWVVADEQGGDIEKLSLENCRAIELGIDLVQVEKDFFKNNTKSLGEGRESIFVASNSIKYLEGFNKALEFFSSKKYSRFDMRICYYDGRHDKNVEFEDYMKVIERTTWDVEIVMKPALKDCGEGETNYLVPAMDKNGCLILRPYNEE